MKLRKEKYNFIERKEIKKMAQRTLEEKDAAYKAKHDAYVEGWNKKDAAFKAKEKAEIAAHHQADGEAMGALAKETIASGRTHAAAVSAFNQTLGKY